MGVNYRLLDKKRFLDKPEEYNIPAGLDPPPGDPIGGF